MEISKKAVILVGHGGLPSDMPSHLVEDFMKVHKTRVRTGSPITKKEKELDSTIRKWKRTPATDPYQFGLETLASHLQSNLKDYFVKTAYNEFCFPAIEDAVDELANENVVDIVVISTMITRGGSHSELEIPEELDAISLKHPAINITYAWPFNMDVFALFLADHVKTFIPVPEFSTD